MSLLLLSSILMMNLFNLKTVPNKVEKHVFFIFFLKSSFLKLRLILLINLKFLVINWKHHSIRFGLHKKLLDFVSMKFLFFAIRVFFSFLRRTKGKYFLCYVLLRSIVKSWCLLRTYTYNEACFINAKASCIDQI